MQAILAYKTQLESYLGDYLESLEGSIYEPVRYIIDIGGKRLRPCLLLAVAEALGVDATKALPMASAIEVFHNFTLLHDDIMDNADQRRGHDTVHIKWNADQAILSGDIMFALSYELLSKSETAHYRAIAALFTETSKQVCIGQQMDMEFEQREDVSEEEYLEMIKLKTSVLIGAAAGMAALYAGVSPQKYSALYDYGLYLGLSFQIQDDILDAFGTQAAVGKRIGGDILQNKKTLLYLRALALANPGDQQSLLEWYALDVDSQEKIDAVKQIMERSGALAALEQVQENYQSMAIDALRVAGLSGDWHGKLADLALYQSKRAH